MPPIYGLSIPDTVVEIYSRFVGTGSMEDSNIWFIGNEEAFDEGQGPIDKFIKYDLAKRYPGKYFPLDFELCHSLSETNPIWKNIELVSSKTKDKLFLGETYFLPSEVGSTLGTTYGLNPKLIRGGIYKGALRTELDNRTKYYFGELEKNYEGKKVIFYGNETFKLKLLRPYLLGKEVLVGKGIDQIEYPTKQTEFYEFSYFDNRVFIAPFVYDQGFLKLKGKI